MSIAWASIVIVVLLLPGFGFLAGLYLPRYVTRETTPISALGQLAIVVGISFVVHALAYWGLNDWDVCEGTSACVAIDQFVQILHFDGSPTLPLDLHAMRAMLDTHAALILGYFMAAVLLTSTTGWIFGILIELGPLRRLAKHQWLYLLIEGRSHAIRGSTEKQVRAHVVTKTEHDGDVIIYVGFVQDFYARADGTITYLVLHSVEKGFLTVKKSGEQGPIKMESIVQTYEGFTQLLVLKGEDIGNVLFEESPPVKATDDEKVISNLTKEINARSAPPDEPTESEKTETSPPATTT
jgi:hypothetical protein